MKVKPAKESQVRKAYKFRLYPNRRQEQLLISILRRLQELYNAALEQRRHAWRSHRKSVSRFDQQKQIVVENLRRTRTDYKKEYLTARGEPSGHRPEKPQMWLAHKAEEAGRRLIKVEPQGRCGFVSEKLPLSQREFRCPKCNLQLNRDLNAARNILRLGVSRLDNVRRSRKCG